MKNLPPVFDRRKQFGTGEIISFLDQHIYPEGGVAEKKRARRREKEAYMDTFLVAPCDAAKEEGHNHQESFSFPCPRPILGRDLSNSTSGGGDGGGGGGGFGSIKFETNGSSSSWLGETPSAGVRNGRETLEFCAGEAALKSHGTAAGDGWKERWQKSDRAALGGRGGIGRTAKASRCDGKKEKGQGGVGSQQEGTASLPPANIATSTSKIATTVAQSEGGTTPIARGATGGVVNKAFEGDGNQTLAASLKNPDKSSRNVGSGGVMAEIGGVGGTGPNVKARGRGGEMRERGREPEIIVCDNVRERDNTAACGDGEADGADDLAARDGRWDAGKTRKYDSSASHPLKKQGTPVPMVTSSVRVLEMGEIFSAE